MRRLDFLSRLKTEGKLLLVEPSNEISDSYLGKADNCLRSARILLDSDLYENSVSMSYYAMYNSLTALLFKVGVKCENHAGSIVVFRELFGRKDLYRTVSFAKKERIDKQYYVSLVLTKKSAVVLYRKAEDFLLEIKLMIKNVRGEDIPRLRDKATRTI